MPRPKGSTNKPKGKLATALAKARKKAPKEEDPEDLINDEDTLLFEDHQPEDPKLHPPPTDLNDLKEPVPETLPPLNTPSDDQLDPSAEVENSSRPIPHPKKRENPKAKIKALDIQKLIADSIATELARRDADQVAARTAERETELKAKKERQLEKARAAKAEKEVERKEIQHLLTQRDAELNKSFANTIGRVRSRMF